MLGLHPHNARTIVQDKSIKSSREAEGPRRGNTTWLRAVHLRVRVKALRLLGICACVPDETRALSHMCTHNALRNIGILAGAVQLAMYYCDSSRDATR